MVGVTIGKLYERSSLYHTLFDAHSVDIEFTGNETGLLAWWVNLDKKCAVSRSGATGKCTFEDKSPNELRITTGENVSPDD